MITACAGVAVFSTIENTCLSTSVFLIKLTVFILCIRAVIR